MSSSRANTTPTYSSTIGTGSGGAASSAKSHVLAGVQDAYWSDDETEDTDCPLCLEEMDLSDLNFKPCTCGYQICRFCWHHIKENLNGRCPACRREYTDDGVQFKPISPEDQKRLNQQKRQRDRERKELENLKRSHLVNMRVVQRNLVYVTGMGSRFAKEEMIPSLRSTEYFAKYGKILKIVLVKRNASGSRGSPVVGLYITYNRREDAARTIAAVDGTASPSGDTEVVRASYGTTKYCMAFLRNLPCTNHGCLDLHEWGDEKDCFTKEDLTTLKHVMKDTETRQRATLPSRKPDVPDAPALPRSASWGLKGGTPVLASASVTPLAISNGRTSRVIATRASRNAPISMTPNGKPAEPSLPSTGRRVSERRLAGSSTATLGQSLASRPTTPAINTSLPPRPTAAAEAAAASELATQISAASSSRMSKVERTVSPTHSRKQKSIEKVITLPTVEPIATPGPAALRVSEEPTSPKPAASRVQDIRQESVPPSSPSSTAGDSLPQTPPPPPGLDGPHPYQLSEKARALVDDLINRRSSTATDAVASPFPDFDRTLSNLGDGSFSFSMTSDPKLASLQEVGIPIIAPSPVSSGFFDPFSTNGGSSQSPISGSSHFAPPGISPRRPPSSVEYASSPLSSVLDFDLRVSRGANSFAGSFNPFGDLPVPSGSPAPSSTAAQDDDPLRRGSKFGFARRDNGSSFGGSAASSPMRYTDSLPPTTPLYAHAEVVAPKPQMGLQQQQTPGWAIPRQAEYGLPPPGLSVQQLQQQVMSGYEKLSPRPQYQSPTGYANGTQQHHHHNQQQQQQQQQTFSPFGQNMNSQNDLSINLRDLLSLSDRQADAALLSQTHPDQHQAMYSGQGFVDPAIMSLNMNSSYRNDPYINSSQISSGTPMGGPPGLAPNVPPPGLNNLDSNHFARRQSNNVIAANTSNNANDETNSSPPSVSAFVSAAPSPILFASDFPSLPATVKLATTKDRTPLILPNVQQYTKPVVLPTTIPPPEPNRISLKPPSVREVFPLPPKPSLEFPTNPALPVSANKKPSMPAISVHSPMAPPPPPAPPVAAKPAARKVRHKAMSPALPISPLPVIEHEAVISRKTKKNKPAVRPIKQKKDVSKSHRAEGSSAAMSLQDSAGAEPETISEIAGVLGGSTARFASLTNIIRDYYLGNLAFFDEDAISIEHPIMEYEPLVRALAALADGEPIKSLPVDAIDAAVSSFQQLLEMLSQTISELLRLLPRLTWTDTASLDSMLKDMIRSGEFMEEDGLDAVTDAAEAASAHSDDMVAVTSALGKRARWMEAQLVKLEGLHHDVNSAAVRVVLYFNDRGWDRGGGLPRSGNSLARFDALGSVTTSKETRKMTTTELEMAFTIAMEDERLAEMKLRQAITINRGLLPLSAQ